MMTEDSAKLQNKYSISKAILDNAFVTGTRWTKKEASSKTKT